MANIPRCQVGLSENWVPRSSDKLNMSPIKMIENCYFGGYIPSFRHIQIILLILLGFATISLLNPIEIGE